jgi:hypothetical protein
MMSPKSCKNSRKWKALFLGPYLADVVAITTYKSSAKLWWCGSHNLERSWLEEARCKLGSTAGYNSRIQFASNEFKLDPRNLNLGSLGSYLKWAYVTSMSALVPLWMNSSPFKLLDLVQEALMLGHLFFHVPTHKQKFAHLATSPTQVTYLSHPST